MGSSGREHLMVDQLLRAGPAAAVSPLRLDGSKGLDIPRVDGSSFPARTPPLPQKIGAGPRAWGALHRHEPKSKRSPCRPCLPFGTRDPLRIRRQGMWDAVQPLEKSTQHGHAADRTSSASPALLTLRQAADYLAVSYWTVRSR